MTNSATNGASPRAAQPHPLDDADVDDDTDDTTVDEREPDSAAGGREEDESAATRGGAGAASSAARRGANNTFEQNVVLFRVGREGGGEGGGGGGGGGGGAAVYASASTTRARVEVSGCGALVAVRPSKAPSFRQDAPTIALSMPRRKARVLRVCISVCWCFVSSFLCFFL